MLSFFYSGTHLQPFRCRKNFAGLVVISPRYGPIIVFLFGCFREQIEQLCILAGIALVEVY